MKTHQKVLLALLIVLMAAVAVLGVFGMRQGWFETSQRVVPPTCTEDGYTVYRGYFLRERTLDPVPALGHAYTVTVTAPTCETGGSSHYRCTRCGHSYEADPTPPTGHTYTYAVTAPTCTEDGYTTRTCTACGHSYRDETIGAIGHVYTFAVTLSTCTEAGYTTHNCTGCTHSYRDNETPPLGHRDQIVITPPTCTAGGYTLHVCQRCAHAEMTDRTAPTGHHHIATVKAPTCTEAGHTAYFCPDCGDAYIADITPATGHTYVAAVQAPTCTEAGYTTYTCRDCADRYVADPTAPLGHSERTSRLPATTAAQGGTLHTCERCGISRLTDPFTYDEVFTGAQGDGEGILFEGIDLSYHNGEVDFAALRRAGITFVILRVGTGKTLPDTRFEEYYAAARAAGLQIGVYYYTYADTIEDALTDAVRVQSILADKTLEYPVFYDVEDASLRSLSPAALTDITLAFCDAMVDAGYYPGVYTNKTWLAEHLEADRIRAVYDIWLASWIVTGENITDYSDDYAMWQYTATGTVSGVTTAVDRNGTYRDFKSIITRYGYNNHR